jgi:hypothetical protein
MTKTVKTAALVAAPAAAVVAAHDDATFISNLLNMDAKARVEALLKLLPGEVAAIGGKSGALASSCYEVLSMMMDRKHGKGWADRKYGGRTLTELEKVERDNLKADLEGMKSTFKANGYSNADQAIKYVKDWSRGLIGKKREPGQNKARPTVQMLNEDMPKLYRRLNNADDVTDNAVALMDAIGAYLVAEGMDLRKVLGE